MIYKDIYYMVRKIGFSAEYVENIAPVEREIYIRYYRDDEKRESKNPGPMSIGKPIDTMGN
jgi:hypothetical protein